MPIPKNAFFYWAGRVPLNYTRYLTMASFRMKNPDWNMYLYTSDSSQDERWGCVFQDFQFNPTELKRIVTGCERRMAADDKYTRKTIPAEWVAAADKILISEDIDPFYGLKYQNKEIAIAFMESKTLPELTTALLKVVDMRKEKDAVTPPPHNYKRDAVDVLGVQLRGYTPKNEQVYHMPPTSVSDVFSLEILIEHGGFYLDLDQLVLRKFAPIADNYEFVMGGQEIAYIGVFGACAGSAAAQSILPHFVGGFDSAAYNSTGITALCNNCINNEAWIKWFKSGPERNHLVPQNWFYPLNTHNQNDFWDGKFNIEQSDSYACHYFGGNGSTKKYMQQLTPENIMTYDNNCLSRWAKRMGRRKELCNM